MSDVPFLRGRDRLDTPFKLFTRLETATFAVFHQQVDVIADLARNVFQIHAVDEHGKTVLREQLRRDQITAFFANLPPRCAPLMLARCRFFRPHCVVPELPLIFRSRRRTALKLTCINPQLRYPSLDRVTLGPSRFSQHRVSKHTVGIPGRGGCQRTSQRKWTSRGIAMCSGTLNSVIALLSVP